MVFYPFDVNLAVDPNNPDVVLRDGIVTFYDPADTGLTAPIALLDTAGLPLPNPVTVSSQGFTPAFQAEIPQVLWVGGGYSGYITSFMGMLDQVNAIGASASSAVTSAEQANVSALAAANAAAAAATAPTDAAVDAGLVRAGSPGVWKPSTNYTLGQYAISPDGALVKAKFTHTSGTDYVPSSWELGAGGVSVFAPLNVKDFGAIGDGVADDTQAIQDALDAVPVGGRAVYMPAGRYKVTSTLRIEKDGTTLYGDGPANRVGATQDASATRIEAATGIANNVLLVQRAANDRPLNGVSLHDFTIDGGLLGTGVNGIHFRVNQGHMDRVHIWRCSGAGLKIQGYTTPAVWDTYDSIFTTLIIGFNTGNGVELADHSADTHFNHCVFLSNGNNMVDTGGASLQVTSCHFYTPNAKNIFLNGSGARSKFVNCKIEGASDHMFVIDTTNGGYSDIQITGCGFSSLNQATTNNAWDYLQIAGPSGNGVTRTLIVGNSFNLKGGNSVKARYAINLSTSAAQNTVIVANSFGPASAWGTAAFNNASNSTNLNFVNGNYGIGNIKLWNLQTANYTLALSDLDGVLELNSAGPVTVTIPPISSVPWTKGNCLEICQVGAGQVTISNGSGVTIQTPRSLTTRAQYSTVRLRMRLSNTWILDGDLT